jgi:hypothetical protein
VSKLSTAGSMSTLTQSFRGREPAHRFNAV